MDVASFAAVLLVGLEASRGARWSAFYYLIITSLASAIYALGVSNAVVPYFGQIINPLQFENTFNGPAQLLLSTAFAIKVGVGPFWYYLLNLQKYGAFADFVFLSTLGKLPHLCALYQMKFYMGWGDFWLISLVFMSALFAVIIMSEEFNMRTFFAYGALANHSVFMVVLFALPPLAQPIFFLAAYIIVYTLLALTFYYSYVLVTTYYNLIHQEPITMHQLNFHMLENHPLIALLFMFCLLTIFGLPPMGIFMVKATLISCGFQVPGSAFYYLPDAVLPLAALVSIATAPFYLRLCYVIIVRGVYTAYTEPMVLLPWNTPKLPIPDYPHLTMLPIKLLVSIIFILMPLYIWLIWNF
jgi:formate hydrogenlyase subunit 3/multisubunit Na+/H+ antiporter MnhD subunit